MKYSSGRLLTAAVLLGAALLATPTGAQRVGSDPRPAAGNDSPTVTCCMRCTGGKDSCTGCTEYTGSKCPGDTVAANCTILSDKALCSPKSTSKPGREPAVGSHLIMRLTPSGGAKPQDFDVEIRDDKIVGVSVIAANGRKEPLSPQSGPTSPGPGGCGSGKKLNCWEDEQKAMSICLCFGAGDIKGTPQTIVN